MEEIEFLIARVEAYTHHLLSLWQDNDVIIPFSIPLTTFDASLNEPVSGYRYTRSGGWSCNTALSRPPAIPRRDCCSRPSTRRTERPSRAISPQERTCCRWSGSPEICIAVYYFSSGVRDSMFVRLSVCLSVNQSVFNLRTHFIVAR